MTLCSVAAVPRRETQGQDIFLDRALQMQKATNLTCTSPQVTSTGLACRTHVVTKLVPEMERVQSKPDCASSGKDVTKPFV